MSFFRNRNRTSSSFEAFDHLATMVAVLDRAEDFSTATCELWLPVERA